VKTSTPPEQITFHEDIATGSSFTWKLKVLDYQVPEFWSSGDPPYKQGDTITLELKEEPSEYPGLVGYYLYASEVNILFDLYRNHEEMTEEEFSWLSNIFGSTPFPFLPKIYSNNTEQYDFIHEYYLNLKNLEGIETDSETDGPFFYNYTTQLEAKKIHSSINVYERIIENYILNTSLSYYLLHWNRFTKIGVNTDTGLVETIEFIIERFDYEYNYEDKDERKNEAYIHYLLKLKKFEKNIVFISVPTSILAIISIIVAVKIKRKRGSI
jgi:hypothetical protein